MSHAATNWAIRQRGIKPAAKVVLWHLCDRYHPDHGCFPSKETLAEDCEMSVRSVYDQIVILEEMGLLKIKPQTFQSASGKYTSNSYILGCDPDFAAYADSPSAKSAVGRMAQSPSANSRNHRRQNLPTNSVNEPVKEPEDFFSDLINGDKFLPQSFITAEKARALVQAGKVTEQRMIERGFL